jgi:hypothetical protein
MSTWQVDATLNDPGLLVKVGVWHDLRNRFERGSVRPRDEQTMAPVDDRLGDSGDPRGGFALAVDDFGEALAGRPVMIDEGETKVFERILLEPIERVALGVGRLNPAVAHRVEKRAKGVERRRMFLISQGFSFDYVKSRSIELAVVPTLRDSIL